MEWEENRRKEMLFCKQIVLKSKPIFVVKRPRLVTSYVFTILFFLERIANSKEVPAGFSLARFVGLRIEGAKR